MERGNGKGASEHPGHDSAANPNAESVCYVEHSIGLIGGKWTLYVVRLLLYQGPSRYNSLLRGIEGISSKVLTQNLRELEEQSIVVRQPDGSAPHVQRYALTESGQRLLPVLKQLGAWAEAHEQVT